MNMWKLPTSLNISGVSYNIRTDFRDILKLLSILNSNDYEQEDKWNAVMLIMYGGTDVIPIEHQEEAVNKVLEFIDCGLTADEHDAKPSIMDWEHDAPLIIPAINKAANCEIRSYENLHWWTFIGYYMEIDEGLFSTVLRLRTKLNKKQNLDKEEKEFYRENKNLVDLPVKLTKEEQDFMDEIAELFG